MATVGGTYWIGSRNLLQVAFTVEIKAGGDGTIEAGLPKALFQTKVDSNPNIRQYCATGDGQRLLLVEPLDQAAEPFNVILNWTAVLASNR